MKVPKAASAGKADSFAALQKRQEAPMPFSRASMSNDEPKSNGAMNRKRHLLRSATSRGSNQMTAQLKCFRGVKWQKTHLATHLYGYQCLVASLGSKKVWKLINIVMNDRQSTNDGCTTQR